MSILMFLTRGGVIEIPVNLPNKPSPKEKLRSLLHAIGGGWYVEKLGQNIPPLKKRKLSPKNNNRRIK